MKPVALEQRSQAWLDWRRSGVTASDAAVILGQSAYKTRWQLWAEKRGLADAVDLSANPHIRRGVEQEDDARHCMEQALNDAPLLPVCGEWEQDPILRASLDGITRSGFPVELKCPCRKVYEEVRKRKELSSGYRRSILQVQFQLLVADAAQGWLCFYHQGLPILPVCIRRDQNLINKLQQEAGRFWQQVITGDEPVKDPQRDVYIPQDSTEKTRWLRLVSDYRKSRKRQQQLGAALDSEKSKQKQLQQSLQALMGDFLLADSDGLRVCRSQTAGAVDYRRALEQLCKKHRMSLPDLDAFRRKGREQVRVTLAEESEAMAACHSRSTVCQPSFYF